MSCSLLLLTVLGGRFGWDYGRGVTNLPKVFCLLEFTQVNKYNLLTANSINCRALQDI
jgi:hypothetical protein